MSQSFFLSTFIYPTLWACFIQFSALPQLPHHCSTTKPCVATSLLSLDAMMMMMMEEFNQQFPELVGLILAAVGDGNVADTVPCKAVCRTWRRLLPGVAAPPSYAAHVAAKGWLSVLQWAHANGCPWDKWTCARAAWRFPHVHKWIKKNKNRSETTTSAGGIGKRKRMG